MVQSTKHLDLKPYYALKIHEHDEYLTQSDVIDFVTQLAENFGKVLSISIDEDTGDLWIDDDGFDYYTVDEVIEHFSITVEQLSTPTEGYLASYRVKQGGQQVGSLINVPKDSFLRAASIETVGANPTTIEQNNNLTTGDKYFKFEVGVANNNVTTLIIPANDMFNIYTADETTIHLDSNNVFSVKPNVFADKNHSHSTYAEVSHTHSSSELIDNNSDSYTNIGQLSTGSSQQVINTAINNKLGSLNIDVIEWDTKNNDGFPSTTASANTMNKLYLIKNTIEEETSNDTLKFTITGNSVTIPYGTFDYDDDEMIVTVDWGDGTVTNYTGDGSDSDSHTYTDGLTSHEVKINGNITTIYGYNLFSENSNLISVSFSSPITKLDYQCFNNCTNLETVELSSVTMLYEECFMGCSSLRNIIIPSTVTTMDTGCFEDCTGLESIEFEWDSSNDILDYLPSWIKDANDDVVFIIPQGTTSLYTAKDYPSEKLVEKTENSSNPSNTNNDDGGVTDAYDVFVTKRTGTSGDYSYNWELIDSVSLDVSGKADISSLSNVAFSGDYDDLTDKPTIPVDVSDLTDTQNTAFTPKTHTHNEYLTKATADTYYQAIGSSSAITSSDLTDVETVEVVVTYTDNSTETLVLLAQTQTQGNGE